MNKKLAVVVHNSTNPYFEVKAMDESGNQSTVCSGDNLGRVLNNAAAMLGHPVIIPLAGPETFF